MKRLAILNYMFLFDPTDTGFSSGSQFESFLADFCAAHGFEANVVETAGSGTKAIYLTSVEVLTSASNSTPKEDIRQQVTKIANRPVPKDFKQTSARGIPYNLLRQKKVPTLTYQRPGQANRQKVKGEGQYS